MPDTLIASWAASWAAWWATVPPSFAFLLALPFVVAVAGLLADAARRRPG